MGNQTAGRRCAKTAGALIGAALGLAVAVQAPPDGLSVEAMRALGIIVWAVVCWILNILPEYVVGLLMCVLWVAVRAVSFTQAFATFSMDMFWILVGAFGMGVAAAKCGLLKRLALQVINLFPASFLGQAMGLLGAGALIAPLIPSATAKSAMAAPIALNISDALGYPRRSRGAAGIFGAMFIGFGTTGPLFLSATFVNFILYGMLPPEVQSQFTWWYWLVAALPWGVFMLAGSALAINRLYRPAEAARVSRKFIADQLSALGPMTREEKITLAVLLLTIALWITERVHGVSAGVVAVSSMCALLGLDIFGREDFRSGIDWPAVIFIGSVNNMGVVIQTLQIDRWIGLTLEPYITAYMSNIYLFIVLLVIAVVVTRFFIVSITAAAVVFTLVLTPLAAGHGINPWIVALVVFASTNVWFAFYENSTYLCAFYATGGEMVEHGQMIKLTGAYIVISTLGFLLSVPYWRWLGLIHG